MILPAVKLDAGRDAGAEEIWLRCRQVDAARILTIAHRGADRLAGAQEVAIAYLDLGQKPIGRRVAAGNRELAGRLLSYLDVEQDTILHRTWFGRNLDGLEVVQILQPPFGPVDQRLVVGIAFGNVELAPDHIFPGTGVAMDLDAFDIGSRALIDGEGNINALRFGIAGDAGNGLRKGKAEFCQFDRETFVGLVQRAGVEYRARPRHGQTTELFAIQSRHVADNGDVAEMIERAFVDRERQRKSVQRGIVFGRRRSHAGIGIALAAVVQPQLLAIGGDAVGVVVVAAGQKAQHVGGGGFYHGGELSLAENLVAHEVDLPNRGLLALGHLKDEVDAVVAAVDDLRYHADIVAPFVPVGLHDTADIGLHCGALQRALRLGLDDRCKLLVLDLLVAFERDAAKHRGFMQMHDQPIAGALDRYIVEHAGRQQRFQRGIARGLVEPPVGGCMKIRTHCFGVDAAIALHLDGFGHSGLCKEQRERGDQHRAGGVRPASLARRDGLHHQILPVSRSTGCDRIARAGRKNVWDKVSCGLQR